jgi:hypothetical protein
MTSSTFLEWLHDVKLLRFTFSTQPEDDRTVVFELECPPDLGFAPLDGRSIRIIVSGVKYVSCTLWGNIEGPDYIDHWTNALSTEGRAKLENSPPISGKEAIVQLTSGSTIELIYTAVHWEQM